MTGVLAMRLEEATAFDIDTLTRTYAPSLPALHTHTVEELLANRGGVRHYFNGADPTKGVDEHFDTMLEAAELFEDDALAFGPGTAYGYSTHGYTLAGAAMEEAVGAPFATLLNDYLSAPYNLPTLQIEDRSVPNALRARLYGGSNIGPVPVVADDVSWKGPGGGCETSVYDYGRLGVRLTNGSLLTPSSLDRMWTPPDGLANYALGWDTGSNVVAKGGEQTGSRSYIRIYPDEQITIALISNQRGHDLPQLGRDIGTLLLNNLSSAALAAADSLAASDASPTQADADELDPPVELGDPAFGVPQPAILQPTATDDATEPATAAFEEGRPEYNVYLPLLLR
ncbi:MAG: beta-lactamase family protein [Chloroflexales bacterium]|nr:beta-lactamase family protein [Chloroflexales bacterium]